MACNDCLRDESCNSELLHAMMDTMIPMCEYGMPIEFKYKPAADVSRDEFRSIKKFPDGATSLSTYALPVTFNPNENQIKEAGLFEAHDGILHTSAYAWFMEDILFDDIDLLRWTVTISGNKYLLKNKGLVDQFMSGWLYYTFSIARL